MSGLMYIGIDAMAAKFCVIVDNNHGNQRLYLWFPFQLHDGGSGHRFIDGSGLSVGCFLCFIIVR